MVANTIILPKLFIVLPLFFYAQNNTQAVILWQEGQSLNWSDFKNKPDVNNTAVAITASGITFQFSIRQTDTQVIDFSTEVHAHFYPNSSWYKPKKVDSHVLEHEQLHFDITELHARKFRQRINALAPSKNLKFQLNSIHTEIKKELKAFQNKYDAETNFSINKEAQAKWKNYVAQELKALYVYRNK